MSRCDVGLAPAIRSNYGSDHSLAGRAEETILCVTERNQLHWIRSTNGMASSSVILQPEIAEPNNSHCSLWRDWRADFPFLAPVKREPRKEEEDGLKISSIVPTKDNIWLRLSVVVAHLPCTH